MKRILVPALATAAVAVAAVAAGGAAAGAHSGPAAHASKGETITLRKVGDLGKILTDGEGHTLYLFEADKTKKSTCYKACAKAWPPVITNGKAIPRGGVIASKLGTTKRKNGKLQVTYNGHPLYYFFMDKKAGQANGEGLHFFGASWYVLSKSGKKVDKD
jgi:predicted lipoprotein with Yx(FWY)xxD motif